MKTGQKTQPYTHHIYLYLALITNILWNVDSRIDHIQTIWLAQNMEAGIFQYPKKEYLDSLHRNII